MAIMRNPLRERYYDPLGERQYYEKEVEAGRQEAVERVKRRLFASTDEAERQDLLQTLRKLGMTSDELRDLTAAVR